MEEHTVELDASKFVGVKNVYFVVTAADNVYVDAWQFIEADPSGIEEIVNSKKVKQQRYDLSGRQLSHSNNHRGIVIEQYTDENGVKHSRKVVSCKE